MSALSRGGLFASFEDDKEEVAAAEVVESADNAEADLGAAQDELNEAEEAARVVDQASDDADTLEEVADTLESREESGGATPEEIEMAEVTVESICNRLGIKKPVSLAAESFTSHSDRKRQTQLAVEGIREIGDSIWQVILKIYKKIREWIMKAWDYFFDARTKLLARAKALEARVDKVEGTPKESVIQGSFIEGLIHQGKFPTIDAASASSTGKGVATSLGELVKGLDAAEKDFKDLVDQANKAISQNQDRDVNVDTNITVHSNAYRTIETTVMKASATLASTSVGMLSALVDDTEEAMSKNSKKAYIAKNAKVGSKVPAFIGDKDNLVKTVIGLSGKVNSSVFLGSVTGNRTEATSNIKDVYDIINKIKVQYVDVGGKVNKDFKAPVLKEEQMSGAVGKVISALEEMEDFNKNKKKLIDSFKKIESIAASAAHVSTGKLSPELKKSITAATKINTKVTQLLSSYFSMLYRYTLDVARNLLDYVQKSLAQYKQDEDDED